MLAEREAADAERDEPSKDAGVRVREEASHTKLKLSPGVKVEHIPSTTNPADAELLSMFEDGYKKDTAGSSIDSFYGIQGEL